MAKQKTLEQLRAEKEQVEKQLAQEQHKLERLENRKKYLEKGERQKRTHRLCNLGGTIESLAPEVKDLTRTEMTELMEHIFGLPEVQRAVRHMEISLLGLWFQSIVVGLCAHILTIAIFLVIYGRMIEIYLVTSIGPIPFATMVNREWGQTGQNYLRSLLALGFQAFLIMICVGIYAVLVENIAIGDDITVAIWECLGYTVLLCYTLFKTGSLAKSLFGAH